MKLKQKPWLKRLKNLTKGNGQVLDLERRLELVREATIEEHVKRELSNPITSEEYKIMSEQSGGEITDTTRLLAQDSINNQRKILEEYSWDQDLKDISKGRGKNIDRESEEGAFNDRVYYKDEIKEVAMDFNLRFLPVRNILWQNTDFKYELVKEIEQYCNRLRNSSGIDQESDRFYALAIAEDFEVEGQKKPKSKEPRLILFYETDKEKGTFVQVKTWGSTRYTAARYIKSWGMQRPSNAWLSRGVWWTGGLFLLNCLLLPWSLLGLLLFSGLLGFGISFLTVLAQVKQSQDKSGKYSFNSERWNKMSA